MRCTKVLGFPPNLLPLLDGLDVCALSQEPFPAAVEQSLLGAHGLLQIEVPFPVTVEQSLHGAHGSLQIEVPFPAVVELEVENLPSPGANFKVAIFPRI